MSTQKKKATTTTTPTRDEINEWLAGMDGYCLDTFEERNEVAKRLMTRLQPTFDATAELLAACKAVIYAFEHDPGPAYGVSAVDQVRAAIAKAEAR